MYCPTCRSAKSVNRSYEMDTFFKYQCSKCQSVFIAIDAWNAFWVDVSVLDCRLALELINASK